MPLYPIFTNPMTAAGDIIVGSTAGAPAKLVAGSNNQVLTLVSGTPAWVVQPTLNYTAQTTTYAAVINDWVVMSSASWTVTLPTAVSQTGKQIILQHAGTSLSQVYTINTTSSQTVGGIASGSYVLGTNGETLTLASDGTNWQILNHQTTTGWASYTLTISATVTPPTKATVVGDNTAKWRRVGSDMEITYHYSHSASAGTAAGSGNYLFPIPANATIDTANISSITNGFVNLGGADLAATTTSNNSGWAAYATTTQVFMVVGNQTNVPQVVSNAYGNINQTSVDYSFNIRIPIVGWRP